MEFNFDYGSEPPVRSEFAPIEPVSRPKGRNYYAAILFHNGNSGGVFAGAIKEVSRPNEAYDVYKKFKGQNCIGVRVYCTMDIVENWPVAGPNRNGMEQLRIKINDTLSLGLLAFETEYAPANRGALWPCAQIFFGTYNSSTGVIKIPSAKGDKGLYVKYLLDSRASEGRSAIISDANAKTQYRLVLGDNQTRASLVQNLKLWFQQLRYSKAVNGSHIHQSLQLVLLLSRGPKSRQRQTLKSRPYTTVSQLFVHAGGFRLRPRR